MNQEIDMKSKYGFFLVAVLLVLSLTSAQAQEDSYIVHIENNTPWTIVIFIDGSKVGGNLRPDYTADLELPAGPHEAVAKAVEEYRIWDPVQLSEEENFWIIDPSDLAP